MPKGLWADIQKIVGFLRYQTSFQQGSVGLGWDQRVQVVVGASASLLCSNIFESCGLGGFVYTNQVQTVLHLKTSSAQFLFDKFIHILLVLDEFIVCVHNCYGVVRRELAVMLVPLPDLIREEEVVCFD